MKSRLKANKCYSTPKRRKNLSYFILPNDVIELYRTREISAVDLTVYAALCSLRRKQDGVRISQGSLARICNIGSEKTIAASVERLHKCGLIKNIIIEIVKHRREKYETSVYQLKPLPSSGFFFVPRHIFLYTRITPKMFAVYFFMCRSRSPEYGKSWNSYNDICERLGFGKCQRSEVVRLIGALVKLDLIKKTVRRIKEVFVDNIYRVCGLEPAAIEKSPAHNRGRFMKREHYENRSFSTVIISPIGGNVKPVFEQIHLFLLI